MNCFALLLKYGEFNTEIKYKVHEINFRKLLKKNCHSFVKQLQK